MNNARDTYQAAWRVALRVYNETVAELRGSNPDHVFNEAVRKARRVFKSRRAGLAGRKTRRQKRR